MHLFAWICQCYILSGYVIVMYLYRNLSVSVMYLYRNILYRTHIITFLVFILLSGGRDFMRSLTSFCGSSWPKTTITSTGDVVLILFNTDIQNNDYYGFLLSYWIVKKRKLAK